MAPELSRRKVSLQLKLFVKLTQEHGSSFSMHDQNVDIKLFIYSSNVRDLCQHAMQNELALRKLGVTLL